MTWIDPWLVDYYNGRALDVHGNRIGKDRQFRGLAIDPDNPPVFESQAAYLNRHELLNASERKRSDFAPETYSPQQRPEPVRPSPSRPRLTVL